MPDVPKNIRLSVAFQADTLAALAESVYHLAEALEESPLTEKSLSAQGGAWKYVGVVEQNPEPPGEG